MKIKLILCFALSFSFLIPACPAAVIVSDSFTYDDGSLTDRPGSLWQYRAGTANQLDVASNRVNLTGSESEDVLIAFPGAPYTSGILQTTFDLNFLALPGAIANQTSYFAHFESANVPSAGRLFATTIGASAGSFRLGIANTATRMDGATYMPVDLSLGVDYSIIMNVDLSADIASFSINGGSSLVASDAVFDREISRFVLRQQLGIGTMTLDNFEVNYTIPEPSSVLLGCLGVLGFLGARRR